VANVTAGQPKPVFKHPAALLEMLESGSGFVEWLRVNRAFHHQYAPFYGDAASFVKLWMGKVPILGQSQASESQQAANRLARQLRKVAQAEMNVGYALNRAGRIYAENWGSPEMRRKKTTGRGFNPDA
jgi:hypothetical protein